jgi:hypothetical protein
MTLHTLLVGQCGNQVGAEFWKLALQESISPADARKSGLSELAASSASRAITKPPSSSSPSKSLRVLNRDFFHLDGTPKCICLDTEPKVVRDIAPKIGLPLERNAVVDVAGRGNNWAMGFNGPRRRSSQAKRVDGESDGLDRRKFVTRGLGNVSSTAFSFGDDQDRGLAGNKTFLEHSLDLVRKEFERYDRNEGCLLFHSIAGGTGSGFGSRMLLELREHYPSQRLMTVSVAPYRSGETPLQNLNSVMTLQALQEYADGVIWFSNDDLMRLLSKDLQSERMPVKFKGSYVRLSTDDINGYIAACLAGLLFPYHKQPAPLSSSLSSQEPFAMWDLISTVCPDRSRKFLEVRTAPIPGAKDKLQSFEYLAEQLTHLAPRFDPLTQKPIFSISSQLVVRGDSEGTFLSPGHSARDEVLKTLSKSYHPVSWNPLPWDIKVCRAPALVSASVTTSLTVCSNRSSIVPQLMYSVNKARQSIRHHAYVHWYEQYGVTVDMLEEACFAMEDCAFQYML